MKKTLQLFCLAFLTVLATNAQNDIGDVFSVGDYDFIITGIGPDEVAVTGTSNATLEVLDIPAEAINTVGPFTYAVTSIGVDAFKENGIITSLILPSTVTTIGAGAFGSCSALAMDPLDLTHVTTVGAYAFLTCPLITSVVVPEGIFLDAGALRATGITSFTMPASFTAMPVQMIRDCKSITSMDIPSTVETMGVAAFRGCTGITQMQVNWTDAADIADATVGNLFNGLTLADITLYVPAGMTDDYEAATVWTDFNIVEGVLGTNKLEKELGFSMYPNPTSGVVNIKIKNITNMDVTVYDINGRALLNTTNSRVDISGFAAGLYVFRVKTNEGQLVKRILKN